MNDVTRILSDLAQGDAQAAGQLLPLVYDELRKLAAARMAEEAPGNTLNATALVHEAYLRLVGPADAARWDNRGHFFAAAAEAMRRILVEAARRKQREKHGGDRAVRRSGRRSARRSGPPPRPRRPRRRPHPAGGRGSASGEAGRAPPLHRAFRRGGGPGPGNLAADRRPHLGVRPGLAAPGTGRHGGQSGKVERICGVISARRRIVHRTPPARHPATGRPQSRAHPPEGFAMTEREIFLAVLDLPDPAARAEYLDRACSGDPARRARIESLLLSHDTAGSFLGSPAVTPPEPARVGNPGDRQRGDPRRRRERGGRRPRFLAAFDQARFPRPHRTLRGSRSPRQGRLRHRVPRLRRDAPARGRDQGAGPADGRHLTRPQTVSARGPVVGQGSAREHRPGVRGRGATAAVPGDGVHPRRNPPATARSDRPFGDGGGARRSAGRSPMGWPPPTAPA